jgi:FixJ family two-component response regulator
MTDELIFELLGTLQTSVTALRAAISDLRQTVDAMAAKRHEMATVREATHRTTRRVRRLEAIRLLATLSARQRYVLSGIMAGQSNKAMAFDLGVSEDTIETHRTRLMQKLKAKSLPDLIDKAILGGLNPPSSDGGRPDDLRVPDIAPGLLVPGAAYHRDADVAV